MGLTNGSDKKRQTSEQAFKKYQKKLNDNLDTVSYGGGMFRGVDYKAGRMSQRQQAFLQDKLEQEVMRNPKLLEDPQVQQILGPRVNKFIGTPPGYIGGNTPPGYPGFY